MAPSIYKWLFIPLLGALLVAWASPRPHPFHVSVVEINHNKPGKLLEISCKIFTDDFERVLRQNYKTRVDIINPPDKGALDKLIHEYIRTHLQITANGQALNLAYLGYEREDDAVYAYLEVAGLETVKKMEVSNKLMYDLFDDQTNLVHVIVDGNRKSSKLEYPAASLNFTF